MGPKESSPNTQITYLFLDNRPQLSWRTRSTKRSVDSDLDRSRQGPLRREPIAHFAGNNFDERDARVCRVAGVHTIPEVAEPGFVAIQN